MKIRPVNQCLIAHLYEEPEKKTLILTSKEPNKDRFVVDFIQENSQGINEGDVILCNKYDALEIDYEGSKIYVIRIEKVIGIIDIYG